MIIQLLLLLLFDESVSISFQNNQTTSKGLTRPTKATEPKEKHSAANREGPQTESTTIK